MADINNSVVHLTMRFEKTTLAIGTGFFYERDGKFFIVTAWHNLTGMHVENLTKMNKHCAIPNNVVAHVPVILPFGATRIPLVLNLTEESRSTFYVHPKGWPRADIAVIPFDPHGVHSMEVTPPGHKPTIQNMNLSNPGNQELPLEIYSIQKYSNVPANIAQKWLNTAQVSEELFIPGYPKNITDYYGQPVWKRSTIASSLQIGWNRQSKFLVDSASHSGMSGAPVLLFNPNGNIVIGSSTYVIGGPVSILAGVYTGRIGVTQESDPQIGIVWHTSVIDEIIDAAQFENRADEIECSRSMLEAAILEEFATCSAEGLDNIKNPEMPSRHLVLERVMEAVNGRAIPNRALDTIVEMAKDYNGPLKEPDT
ncbi:hypothetical protein [Thalassospira lucentensis]|uniref:hypothetical protein n=1 Tax=Thalassospira lucentensis TaxID=168935 RepID=UPI003AA7ADB4